MVAVSRNDCRTSRTSMNCPRIWSYRVIARHFMHGSGAGSEPQFLDFGANSASSQFVGISLAVLSVANCGEGAVGIAPAVV